MPAGKLRPMLGIDFKTARHTWSAALVLVVLAIVYLIRETLFVFVIALMFAYLLYPLFDAIDRWLGSKRRGIALAITYILVLALFAGLIGFIGNHVGEQAGQLAAQIRQ